MNLFTRLLPTILLVFTPMLGGCNISDIATPEEKAAVEAFDASLAEKSAEIDALTLKWEATLDDLDDALAKGVTLEAEEFKALTEGAVAATEAAKLAHGLATGAFAEIADARNEKVDAIFQRTAAPIIPFVPDALKPFLPLAMLAFKRVRVQLGSVAVNAADALKLATEMEFKKAGVAVLATGKSVIRTTTPFLNSELHEQPQEIAKAQDPGA